MSSKRNLFLGLLIGLVLGGALPAFLCLHGWTSAENSRVVELRQGWNQLVWTPDNQPADTALAAIAGDLAMVYGWQGDSQTFSRYIPGRADVSTMGQVEKDSGYWLLMTRDAAFSVPTADGQQCPKPTPCPTSTPSPSCGDCQLLAVACALELGECRSTSTCLAACNVALAACVMNAPTASLAHNCVGAEIQCVSICVEASEH